MLNQNQVKERGNLDLLMLVCELPSSCFNVSFRRDARCFIEARKEMELRLASQSNVKQSDEFPNIDFMKDIAMELSRNELIKRLCEMNESYQLMRKEWFEKTHLGKVMNYYI